ncbi:MAG: DUF4352 domain-containing protein [Ruminococcus sp.]|uniref:DUF4352 domain-containing protein n=1 Tax=Ruminococcus sp. TaxID=41978 RepID=UPI0025F386E7|nr:DUF4352 domain-containing protein [Ruminococcus sp.]MCR5601659.1 DUF4352 domain-containing protein [Ruminococcus sp.]
MKTRRLSGLLLAALIAATASTGCLSNKKKTLAQKENNEPRPTAASHSPVDLSKIGTNVINGEIGKEVEANDTVFTLNSVIDAGVRDNEKKFIYFDITLKNNTANAYSLSTINNFYITIPEGDIYSDVQTQLYAKSHFAEDKYYVDPFDIPSNGQFSGLVGGFKLEENANSFEVSFYPTGDDPNNKETVIKYEITADDIQAPSDDIVK